MSDNEFDDIPDDFADIRGVDWAQLLGPSTSSTHTVSMHPGPEPAAMLPVQPSTMPSGQQESSDSSSYFYDDENMDTAFLAELDRLEETFVRPEQQAPSTSTTTVTDLHHTNEVLNTANTVSLNSERTSRPLAPEPSLHQITEQRRFQQPPSATLPIVSSSKNAQANSKRDGEYSSDLPRKKPHLDGSPYSISPLSKGKLKANDILQQILSNYEDELTCPICCDLFVASHVGNPCGHNFCGDCGWQWHYNAENRNKGCPCCRKTLDATIPMIPNISMDNTVEKHVQALALSGIQEWEPGGRKHEDWNARKKAWRNGTKQRENLRKKKAPQRNRTIVSLGTIHVFDAPEPWLHQEDNSEEDPTYEEGDVELIPRPVQPVRWRRGRGR